METHEQMQHANINGRDYILFRKDDFYSVLIPNKEIRQSDIPEIHRLFLDEYNKMYGKKSKHLLYIHYLLLVYGNSHISFYSRTTSGT